MKVLNSRRNSCCPKLVSKEIDLMQENNEEIPIKYYIAQQMFKAAQRNQNYIKNQLQLMNAQNTLLEGIREKINSRGDLSYGSNVVNILDDDQTYLERSFSARLNLNTLKRQSFVLDQSNNTSRSKKSRSGKQQDTLNNIDRMLSREDYEYVLGLINQNKALKRQIEEQQRFKSMFEAEKKSNQIIRLQVLKYQGKIGELDKKLTKSEAIIKQLKKEKQNYEQSMSQIQSQLRVNTTNSTNLMINQKILKNQRKRFQLEKQMLSKMKKQLDAQMDQIENGWKQYLPAQLVREGKENIKKYNQLLKQQYTKIKGLNEQIQSFNSKLTII